MRLTRRQWFQAVTVAAAQAKERSFLVRGGSVFTPEGLVRADLRVRGEIIEAIDERIDPLIGEPIYDASERLVLPGGIDPHAHLGPPWVDDFRSGSEAALAGGITTIGCMTGARENETLDEAIARETQRVTREAIADIFLHPIVSDPGSVPLDALHDGGVRSLKVFMVNRRFDERESEFRALFERAAARGLLMVVHCEDASLLRAAAERLEAAGTTSLRYFAESRPVEAEVRAVERAVQICEATRAPIYIVHLSSKRALDVCRDARERGLPVHVETRPLYLYFTSERFRTADGPLYIGQPPLREPEDVEAMWAGLADGSIETLGTDHAPWTREQKLDPELDIGRLRPGVSNLQLVLPMLYSDGVASGRLTLERFVAVTSSNAAKLFGLYPRKGAIRVGSDADLALWDPTRKRTVRRDRLRSRAGFSLYEGREVTGWPVTVFRRGERVFDSDRLLASDGGRLAQSSFTAQ